MVKVMAKVTAMAKVSETVMAMVTELATALGRESDCFAYFVDRLA